MKTPEQVETYDNGKSTIVRQTLSWMVTAVVVLLVADSFGSERSLFVSKNACPFECCTYGEWQVVEPVEVHEYPRMGSRTIGSLTKGEVVQVVTGEVHVDPGIARILTDPPHAAELLDPSQPVEILDYLGEGYSNVRQGETISQLKIARTLDRCTTRPNWRYCWVEVNKQPESHWWVQLGSGYPLGWVSMESPGLKPEDACS